jgi:hypothetical protein
MISREVMLGLLEQLPDDKLLAALAVAGGGGNAPGGSDFDPVAAMSLDKGNSIVPWNKVQVEYGGGNDRPELTDRKWAKGKTHVEGKKTGNGPEFDMGEGEGNIFLQTGGGC